MRTIVRFAGGFSPAGEREPAIPLEVLHGDELVAVLRISRSRHVKRGVGTVEVALESLHEFVELLDDWFRQGGTIEVPG